MCNILWNEKSVQKVHTVHKTLLLLEVSLLSISSFVHKYPNIQNVNILPLFLHHCKCRKCPFLSMQLDAILGLTKLRFLWSWCLPQHKLSLCSYFEYLSHVSFCTKNSQTLLSISSFVHKYPNIQNVNILPLFLHHCKCPFLSVQLDARLSLTKLRFLWSWYLPQFLHKKFTNFTFHIIIYTQISKYPNGCYLHTIIMHRTVIASIIKAITVLCV